LKSLCFFVVLTIEFFRFAVLAVYSLSLWSDRGAVWVGIRPLICNAYRTHDGILLKASKKGIFGTDRRMHGMPFSVWNYDCRAINEPT
jgi:hypothetical protein